MRRSLLVAVGGVAAVVAVAGCGESAQPGPTESPPATASISGLPFHYQGHGESSSPSFHVDRDGTYTITYHLAGDPLQPNCLVSLSVISGSGQETYLVNGVTLTPTTVKDGSTPLSLTAGDWRFQEAGGCNWTVTVVAAPQ